MTVKTVIAFPRNENKNVILKDSQKLAMQKIVDTKDVVLGATFYLCNLQSNGEESVTRQVA